MEDLNIAGVSRPLTAENAPAAESIEGYVLIITNLHPETTEDHIIDTFEEYCKVVNLHLTLDKKTGYSKGYALIEFHDVEDAKEIMEIQKNNKFDILGNLIEMDYAFVENSNIRNRFKSKFKNSQSDEVRNRLEGLDKRERSPTRNL